MRLLWRLLTAIPKWAFLTVYEYDDDYTPTQNQIANIITAVVIVLILLLLL